MRFATGGHSPPLYASLRPPKCRCARFFYAPRAQTLAKLFKSLQRGFVRFCWCIVKISKAKSEAAQQAQLQKLHEDSDALAKRAIAAEQESAVLKARLEAMAEAEIRSAKTLTDLRESAERTALAAATQLKEQAGQHEARLKQLQVERDEARSDARGSLERAAKAEGQLQALQAVVKSEGNQDEKASSIADESKPVAKAPVKRTGAKKS